MDALERALSRSTEQSSTQLDKLIETEQKQLDELRQARQDRETAAATAAAEDGQADAPDEDAQQTQAEATAALAEQVKGTRSLVLTSGGLLIFLAALTAMRSRK